MKCKHIEEKLPLYFYEELVADERAEVEAHLAECAHCAEVAAEFGRLRAALDERPIPEPSPTLLVHCRSDLEEALDREQTGWRALVRGWFGQAPGQPALRWASAVAILVVGFSAGWTMQGKTSPAQTGGNQSERPWFGADMTGVRINGITQVAPDPQTGEVKLTLNAERQVTLEGSLDDPRIQNVLVYAMKNYDNPGIRHDSVEALGARSNNPTVREALLHAALHDPNPGVRLEALDALRESAGQAEVRGALLDVLKNDENPGVRVAAIDILLEDADDEDVPVLAELAREHQNPYVRYKCTKALRERVSQEQ
ncbi:MAG: HEAT repeat domain-containing protein [Acidobacteria bacterium]|nr:HEAT repeat domain-containing protein [Acidobacteriota bacterium]